MTRAPPLRDRRRVLDRRTRSIAAARHLRELGFRALEAYTPLPGRRARRDRCAPAGGCWLPLMMFAAAVFGACWGYFIQYWDEALELSAQCRRTARTTAGRLSSSRRSSSCCCCAIAAGFFGLLAACRLPLLYHPIFDADEFERASRDRFVLCVEARDPQLRAAAHPPIFERLGAERIDEVLGVRRLALIAARSSGDGVGGLRQHGQPAEAARPYECRYGAEVDLAGAAAAGHRRARRQADAPAAAGHDGAARARPAALRHLLRAVPRPCRRRQRHDRAARLSAPALLSTSTGCAKRRSSISTTSSPTATASMFPYAARVAPPDRWAIIAYIRALQASASASSADVPPESRQTLQ